MSQIHYDAINTVISPIDTSIIRFNDQNSKPILEIGRDGKIIIGEGYTPTEAGDAFIRRILDGMPQYFGAEFKDEIKALKQNVKRLENENQHLKNELNSSRLQLEAWVEDYHRLQDTL